MQDDECELTEKGLRELLISRVKYLLRIRRVENGEIMKISGTEVNNPSVLYVRQGGG